MLEKDLSSKSYKYLCIQRDDWYSLSFDKWYEGIDTSDELQDTRMLYPSNQSYVISKRIVLHSKMKFIVYMSPLPLIGW